MFRPRFSLVGVPRQERTHATYKTYSFEPLLLHFQVELAVSQGIILYGSLILMNGMFQVTIFVVILHGAFGRKNHVVLKRSQCGKTSRDNGKHMGCGDNQGTPFYFF
mgnify:CR=1 FL=1